MNLSSEQVKLWRQQQRTRFLDERKVISASLRNQWQQYVEQETLKFLTRMQPGIMAFYLPIRGELDCKPVAEQLIKKGWRTAIPVIREGVKTLTFCEWTPETEMTSGVWQIPIPKNEVVLSPDVMIIPLVGFDVKGFRLGYGGGYYDRTVAAMTNQPLMIGIGLEQSLCETIYPHQYDIAMDIIITENRVLNL